MKNYVHAKNGWKTRCGARLLVLFFVAFPLSALAVDATLSVSPSTGDYNVNEAVTARIFVASDGAKINGVEGVLSFDPKEIEVKSISRDSSVLTSWPEPPSFDNEKGEIKFSGLMATTSVVARGRILSITLVPLRVGTFQLNFVNGAAIIIAADGTGGNIVSTLKNGSFSATPSDIADVPFDANGEVLGVTTETTLASLTHPDQEAWYQNGTSTLTWEVASGVAGLRLGIDQKPNGGGRVSYGPTQKTKTIPHIDDGVWYFHLTEEFEDGSEKTSQYRLQIDTTPPTEFTATEVARENPALPIVTIALSATDGLSGLDHYEFVFDKGVPISWVDDGSGQFHSEKLSSGKHELVVAAVDRAGNRSESTLTVVVDTPPPPHIILRGTKHKEGGALPLQINSLPGGTVEVSISRNKDTPVVEEFTLDGTGKGEFSSALILVPGTYQAWAVLRDAHGMRSSQSEWVSTEVETTLAGIIGRNVPTLSLFGGGLMLLSGIVFFLWRRRRSRDVVEYEGGRYEENLSDEVHPQYRSRSSEPSILETHRVVLGGVSDRSTFEPTRL